MSISVKLIDRPWRKAIITIADNGQKLAYTLYSPSISDEAWSQLMEHGFNEDTDGIGFRDEENPETREFRDRIASVTALLKGAIGQLEKNNCLAGKGESFVSFTDRIIEEDRISGETASKLEKYRITLSRFRRYLSSIGKEELLVSNLSSDIIEGFNSFLLTKGLKRSTVAFYNRILGAIYNRAIKLGVTADNTPFANVTTQVRS